MSFFSRIVRDARGPSGLTSRLPASPDGDTAIDDMATSSAPVLGAFTAVDDEPGAVAARMAGAREPHVPPPALAGEAAPAALGEAVPAALDDAGMYERGPLPGDHRLAVSEVRTAGDHETDPDHQGARWRSALTPQPGPARVDAAGEVAPDDVVSASEPGELRRPHGAPAPGREPTGDRPSGAVDRVARSAVDHSTARGGGEGRTRAVAERPAPAEGPGAGQPASTHGMVGRAPGEGGTPAQALSDSGARGPELLTESGRRFDDVRDPDSAPMMPVTSESATRPSRTPALGGERDARDVRQRPPAPPAASAAMSERAMVPGSREVSREPRSGAHVHIGRIDIVVVAPEPARPASAPPSTNLANRLYLRSL